jgi:hypothetical protein
MHSARALSVRCGLSTTRPEPDCKDDTTPSMRDSARLAPISESCTFKLTGKRFPSYSSARFSPHPSTELRL